MENIKTLFQNKKFEQTKDAKYTSEFEKYVHLTAKLINRSYIETYGAVRDWDLHLIKNRYHYCKEQYQGEIPRDILWWYLRKKEITNQ